MWRSILVCIQLLFLQWQVILKIFNDHWNINHFLRKHLSKSFARFLNWIICVCYWIKINIEEYIITQIVECLLLFTKVTRFLFLLSLVSSLFRGYHKTPEKRVIFEQQKCYVHSSWGGTSKLKSGQTWSLVTACFLLKMTLYCTVVTGESLLPFHLRPWILSRWAPLRTYIPSMLSNRWLRTRTSGGHTQNLHGCSPSIHSPYSWRKMSCLDSYSALHCLFYPLIALGDSSNSNISFFFRIRVYFLCNNNFESILTFEVKFYSTLHI